MFMMGPIGSGVSQGAFEGRIALGVPSAGASRWCDLRSLSDRVRLKVAWLNSLGHERLFV